ncbi:GntR family transcriptional regulator [Beduini massiliensis]|uniref:GntR family transcriptional regulator n=1 Tax=Beduini massiliensis TaxID=1585974 RepID=UPI00059AB554|nr:GntR family transcriptional regulator [Beduini massiliensis]
MKNSFDPNLPIYLQVMDEIKKDVFTHHYLPGHKIASVRELALQYSVNPNTIQKALSELERVGLLHSERTVGRFVTEDLELIDRLRYEISHEKVHTFVSEMKGLGYDRQGIIDAIDEEFEAQ